jgi:hypothetical protein
MTKDPKPSLAETHPELCMEWDTESNPSHAPTDVSRGSNLKVNWICRICRHRWAATVHNRSRGRGCPECKNRTISKKLRTPKFGEDLATRLPDLAEQWHPTKNGDLKPENVFPKSNRKVWWLCNDCDHEWSAVIGSRASGYGCPECKKRAISKKLRIPKVGKDLATLKPELAKQWHPTKNGALTPKDVKAFSHDNIWWLCENGHEWSALIASRSKNGCPFCSGREPIKGETDLATANPYLAGEWHPTKNGELTPQNIKAFSHANVWWKCKLDHEYLATCTNRSHGDGCPICSNQQILVGENDLATTNPELTEQWHPTLNGDLTAFDLPAGSNQNIWWICTREHTWKATVFNRAQNKSGCPYCSGNRVITGETDLATNNPILAAQWHPTKNGELKPSEVTTYSNIPIWWICDQGHEWRTSPNGRKNNGCASCAVYGFSPSEPAWLYLIENFDLDMFQIGISNAIQDRIQKHSRSGWEILEVRGPMDGFLTKQLETSCLNAAKKRGAIFGNKAGINKFDGYTEAWTKASLSVTSIKQILDWVYEDESK